MIEINPIDYFGLTRLERFDLLFVDSDDGLRTSLVYPVMSSLAYLDLTSDMISYTRLNDPLEFILDKCFVFGNHLVGLSGERNRICVVDVPERHVLAYLTPQLDGDVCDLSLSDDSTRLALISQSTAVISVWTVNDSSRLIGKIILKSK